MFPYDGAILAAIQAPPPQSVSDVVRMLKIIDGLCVDGDGLRWFNRLYLRVTEAVAARIAAGGFTDAPWLAQLDVQFADLYLSALQSALSAGTAPACW